jgi:hypothetical protein
MRTVLVFVLLLGCLAACDNATPTPPATAGGAGLVATPTTPAESPDAPASGSVVVDPAVDRIQAGNKLPVSIPASAGVEVEGGAWVGGSAEFSIAESKTGVSTLKAEPGMVWVHVLIEPSNKKSMLGKSVATAERVLQPVLHDDAAGTHFPLGYIYTDAGSCKVMLDLDAGVRALSQAPMLMQERSDQRLWLLFRVPSGSKISKLLLGRKTAAEWQPAVAVR